MRMGLPSYWARCRVVALEAAPLPTAHQKASVPRLERSPAPAAGLQLRRGTARPTRLGIGHPPNKQHSIRRFLPIRNRKGRFTNTNGGGAEIRVIMRTEVATAAVVPSSLTFSRVLCRTSLMRKPLDLSTSMRLKLAPSEKATPMPRCPRASLSFCS
jgi:hypothetical protein